MVLVLRKKRIAPSAGSECILHAVFTDVRDSAAPEGAKVSSVEIDIAIVAGDADTEDKMKWSNHVWRIVSF